MKTAEQWVEHFTCPGDVLPEKMTAEDIRLIQYDALGVAQHCESEYDPTLDPPPPHIVRAAIDIENWFKSQGIEHWKLMGIQSREG